MLNLFWHSMPYNYLTLYFNTLNYTLSSLPVLFSLVLITTVLFNIIFSIKTFTHHLHFILFFIPCCSLLAKPANINLGLINVLSFWHPTLLLIVACFLLKYTHNLFFGMHALTVVVYLFICLGCWWASQELLWMGWWNWDGVENSLLLLFILVFALSHFIKNFYELLPYRHYSICFFIIYFLVLNKTNLFKSIHSFTNSTINNFSLVLLLYSIFLFLMIQLQFRLKLPFIYNLVVWVLYLFYFCLTNSNVFSKLSVFFLLNCTFWYLMLLFTNPIYVYIICFYPDIIHLTLFAVVSVFLLQRSLQIKFHKLILFSLLVLGLKFCFKNYVFWTLNNVCTSTLCNVTQSNRLLNKFNVNILNIFEITQQLKLIFKNSLLMTPHNYAEFSTSKSLPLKQLTYGTLYEIQFYFFLGTLTIYLKQKLKYKYYNQMYLFQSDLTINQQKNRRVNTKVSRYHWSTKSVWTNTKTFFILSNQSTIDLRFYKLILRKIKKKFFKYRIQTFVYIVPNNKTSHKSKNSRMGKGKGMNNRFYYRHKYTKPVLIFKNFSSVRLLKLKIFLRKFFSYKYY